MAIKLSKQEQEELINKIEAEYTSSINFTENKRELFRQRFSLYNNISDNNNKIYVRLIYSVMQTLIALYYADKPKAEFAPRKMGDEKIAENITNLANFDWEEMDLDQLKYQVQWDRFFFGVGIEIRTGWNSKKKIPRVQVANPLSRVPDPNFDHTQGARFHGFELETNKHEITKEKGFFNIEDIKTEKQLENEETEQEFNQTRDLQNQPTKDELDPGTVGIYYHYTIFKGKKYMAALTNQRTLLVKLEEIKPVGNDEEAKFPVVVRWWSPLRGDPYGVSIPDIMEDKQAMIQLFMNLNRIKAENSAWGDMFLYDKNAVDNVKDLQIPTLGPKYVKADLNQNPQPIQEVPRATQSQEAVNAPDVLQQQANEDIGLDARSMGISPNASLTATENQRVQKNANMKLLLGTKIDGWGEKRFWKDIWYNSYKQHFNWRSEKNIRINNQFHSSPMTVKKDDFTTHADIDVTIKTKQEKDEEEKQKQQSLSSLINLVLQNPNTPQISKDYAKRRLFELSGMSNEESNLLFPPSYEERIARLNLELLNRNEDVFETTEDFEINQQILNEDHLTFITIYQQALDTDKKEEAINIRWELFIQSGQFDEQREMMRQQGEQGMDRTIQNQLTNAQVQSQQQEDQSSPSLQDVKAG